MNTMKKTADDLCLLYRGNHILGFTTVVDTNMQDSDNAISHVRRRWFIKLNPKKIKINIIKLTFIKRDKRFCEILKW